MFSEQVGSQPPTQPPALAAEHQPVDEARPKLRLSWPAPVGQTRLRGPFNLPRWNQPVHQPGDEVELARAREALQQADGALGRAQANLERACWLAAEAERLAQLEGDQRRLLRQREHLHRLLGAVALAEIDLAPLDDVAHALVVNARARAATNPAIAGICPIAAARRRQRAETALLAALAERTRAAEALKRLQHCRQHAAGASVSAVARR